LQSRERQGLARFEHDHRHGALAPALVRNADHRRVLDLRQLVNDALHLG
jgi:hypothetical protein